MQQMFCFLKSASGGFFAGTAGKSRFSFKIIVPQVITDSLKKVLLNYL